MNATNKRSLGDMLVVWILGFLAGAAPGVSISDRDSAIFAVYMLCMIQAPR